MKYHIYKTTNALLNSSVFLINFLLKQMLQNCSKVNLVIAYGNTYKSYYLPIIYQMYTKSFDKIINGQQSIVKPNYTITGTDEKRKKKNDS